LRRTPRSTASSGTREPFDYAQLTALSNLCEPSSSAAANAVDSDAVLSPLKAAVDLPTQGRARAGSVSSRLSAVFRRTVPKPATPTPSSPAVVATSAGGSPSVPRHAAVVDNIKGQGRSRLASMPVRPQFNVTELALPASKPTSRPSGCGSRRSQPRALSSWRARRRRRRHRRHSSSEQ
jgi:hypothetical protein